MSKTITIPTNCNPYIVVINNHVYAYRAGDSVEVPDEVAEVIEDALELEPKPAFVSANKLSQLASRTIVEVTADDLAGVTEIPRYLFEWCSQLKRVEIPGNITSIGYYAFANCTSLEMVVLMSKTPPTIQAGIFNGCPNTCKYAVPKESLELYKTAEYWDTIASRFIAMEE
jgi:hypothetical protein